MFDDPLPSWPHAARLRRMVARLQLRKAAASLAPIVEKSIFEGTRYEK